MLEEVEHFLAQFGGLGFDGRLFADFVAWAREVDVDVGDDGGFRALGHDEDAVGEQDCFVNVVGDHDDGAA